MRRHILPKQQMHIFIYLWATKNLKWSCNGFCWTGVRMFWFLALQELLLWSRCLYCDPLVNLAFTFTQRIGLVFVVTTGYICGRLLHRMNRRFQYRINKLFKTKKELQQWVTFGCLAFVYDSHKKKIGTFLLLSSVFLFIPRTRSSRIIRIRIRIIRSLIYSPL